MRLEAGNRSRSRKVVAGGAVLGATLLVAFASAGVAYDGGTESVADNPCLGPDRLELLCPDLRISPPSDLRIRFTPGGRRLLDAKNNIRSRGRGPLELRGIKIGPRRMKVRQRIDRVGGGKLVIPTKGRLDFYPIPGQYRYWKFRDAARFEIWSVNPDGSRVRRRRVGPKIHYCFRDLKRTKPSRISPRNRVYPACSQNPDRRSVVLGTSVGWSDIYPADYHQNYIDVSGLRGCFAFYHVADPKNHIRELNENNNSARVLVYLSRNGIRSCRPRQARRRGRPARS